jgi:hypothetical protein
MAILTGKPTSISANAPSDVITLDTSEFLNLVDDVTADQYWQDASRIKSIIFVYRNSSRQRVNLKFSLPSTSSTVPLNENYRNGVLTCSKIKIIGMANDTLSIPRSSFITDTEFDMSVIDGYAVPGLQGAEAIVWSSPITTTFSTVEAEADGGLYKNNGPDFSNGGSAAYDISVRSSQELSTGEGFFEIDMLIYNGMTPEGQANNSTYGPEEVVGFSYGSRTTNGDYNSVDFAIKRINTGAGGPSEKSIQVYENGFLNSSIANIQSPSGGMMGGADYFKNKIRVQLKNGNIEFFVNNGKYKTLVGALASVSYPLFVEASLKNPAIVGQPTTGSGFQASRIGSSASIAGTVVRTADFTLPSVDADVSTMGGIAIVSQQYVEFAEQPFPGSPYGIAINNVSSYAGYTFQTPVVEGNPYTIRIHVNSYVDSSAPGTPSPSLSISSGDPNFTTTVSASSLSAAVGSYVDVSYTPTFYESIDPNGFRMFSNVGLEVYSQNTTQFSYIRISKVEIIEA